MDVGGLEIIVGAFLVAATVISTVLIGATILSYVILRESHEDIPTAPVTSTPSEPQVNKESPERVHSAIAG